MKINFKQAALSILISGTILSAVAGGPEAPMVISGFYIGLGGAYDTYYSKNNYSATASVTSNLTGQNFPNLNLINNSISGTKSFSKKMTQDQFGAMAQIGYWAPIDSVCLWGLQASYKYTNYSYNLSTNAAEQNFASQAFQAQTTQPLTAPIQLSTTAANTFWINQASITPLSNAYSTTSFNNELLLLAFLGVQFEKGYAYLGLGAVMFTYKDHFQLLTTWNLNDPNYDWAAYTSYNAAGSWRVNTANPLQQIAITHLYNAANVSTPIFIASSGSQSKSSTIWGGAFQVGYNYYFLPTWFLNVNYTYTLTGTYKFTTTIANPNITWFSNPIPSTSQWANTTASYSGTTLQSTLGIPSFNANNAFTISNLNITRKIQLEAQEFMFSINKVFEL